MIAVSTKFTNTQKAPANLPVSQVQLVLGNYASSAAYGTTIASSSDFSADYPALGAIDGDRTEINVGPAAGADDFVGKSSWRSGGKPDLGDTVTLTLTFLASKTINRIKLYNLNNHGLKTYSLSYWNGSAFVVFAATSDIVSGGQTSITPTYELDTIDFSDISTTQIKLIVTHTQVTNDYANVVELEVYRKIDITDRVKSIQVQRQRDYKIANPLASTVTIQCANQDRFFSLNHVPTVAEVAAGFVNSELQPNLQILVSLGWNTYSAANEFVSTIVAYVDRFTVRPSSRDVEIQGRDGMKPLINKIDTCNLKSGLEIGAIITYLLNRANVSTYEMAIDTTPVFIDYFFTEAQDILTTIRDLSQAAGDSLFFFDEYGIATYQYYATAVPLQKIWTTEAQFEAGTLINIATLAAAIDTIQVPILFDPALADGTLSGTAIESGSNVTFSAYPGSSNSPVGTYGLVSGVSVFAGPNPNNTIYASSFVTPLAGTMVSVTFPDGQWRIDNTGNGGTMAVYARVWADNGDSPNLGTVLYSNTLVNLTWNRSDPPSNGTWASFTINPAISLTAGQRYWIGIEGDLFAIDNFSVASVRCQQGSAQLANSGDTWQEGGSSSPSTTPVYCAFTMNSTVSGGWTSPTYDSQSISVGLSPTVTVSGSYPTGTDGLIYLEGSPDGTTWDVSYSQDQPNGSYVFSIANRRYWRLRIAISTTTTPNIPAVGTPEFLFSHTGTWDSDVKDLGTLVSSFSTITFDQVLNGGMVVYSTRSGPTSVPDGSWSAFVPVDGSNNILSPVNRYIQVQAFITLASGDLATPVVEDIIFNYVGGSGRRKYPLPPSSFTFSFDSTLLDVQQEVADNLGGDSAILNDVICQAQPLQLTGADSDKQWELLQGTPPVPVSPSNPFTVSPGTYVFYPVISGGMDISRMTGANPPAAVFTSTGGAVFSWSFIHITPILPVLQVIVTNAGSITSLQIQGKAFTADSTSIAQEFTDAASIASFGDRQLTISNQWVVTESVALYIATTLVGIFKAPFAYIPSCKIRPTFNIQIGDRVTISDINLDMTADYLAVGVNQTFNAQDKSGSIETDLVLLQVPAGD